MWGDEAERAALRAVAHLLPDKWRQIIDVAAAAVPPTPEQRIPAPTDAAAKRLDQIEHIVVVMLENRSFDHMFGYLSLPVALGGRGRADVDGLKGPETNFNVHDGTRYPIHHLAQTQFTGEAEDPDHSGGSVDQQLADGGRGFVDNFARISAARVKQLNVPLPDPGLVMGYYDGDDLPVYDHLAAEYCVVDRWFSAVPGATWLSNAATWPNTLLILTYDEHGGFYDHVAPPQATDDRPDFRRLGVRVLALLISPLVTQGSTSTTLPGADFHFDHTSIMKTIFTCFCRAEGQIPEMTAWAGAANHFGHLLSGDGPRADVPDHSTATKRMTEWRSAFTDARFKDPTAAVMAPHELTDFQNGCYEMARLLRHAGLAGGHP
jgi:hypothetical protein